MDYPDAHLEASHYSHAVAGPAAHRKSPPKRSLDGALSRDGYGITKQVYNVRRFGRRRQIRLGEGKCGKRYQS